MIKQIIIALFFVVLGIIVLAGKGDMLIAGYNTAPKEEKEKVNIKRLRLLIGGLLVVIEYVGNEEINTQINQKLANTIIRRNEH